MMYAFVCRNAQRPGIISGMTLREYKEASQPTPDTLVVLVRMHKGSRPARVVASDRAIAELAMCPNILRPLFIQEDSPLLFCTREGGHLLHISRKLSELAKSFGSTIPPATAVRKAIATAGGALGDREKSALAHSMSHSQSTADAYYRAYGQAKSVEGFQAVGNLLEIPSAVKKRQKFTEAQTECLSAYFKTEIREKVQPSGAAIASFLKSQGDLFKGRTRGDIYSKIRNLIGRK